MKRIDAAVDLLGMTQVVLRDFDGSETIVPRELPLPEVIHTSETDPESDVQVTRHYLKTQDVDTEGRPVYAQSNL